jgi:hypothetical protein
VYRLCTSSSGHPQRLPAGKVSVSQTVDVLTSSTLRAKKILPTARAPGRHCADHRQQELKVPIAWQMALVAAFATLGLSDFIRIHAGYAVDAAVSEDELKELVYLTRSEGIVLYNSD